MDVHAIKQVLEVCISITPHTRFLETKVTVAGVEAKRISGFLEVVMIRLFRSNNQLSDSIRSVTTHIFGISDIQCLEYPDIGYTYIHFLSNYVG